MATNGSIYPLDHPRTKQSAAEFNRARRTRSSNARQITYEFLFNLFCNKDLTFTDIARKAKLSDQAIHRLYDAYFLGIVGNETGTERLHAIRQRKLAKKLEGLKVPDRPALKKVEEVALEQLLEVRPYINHRSDGKFTGVSMTKLRIGGVGCKIHPITTCTRPKGGRTVRYGVFEMSRKLVEEEEIHIFVFLCEGVTQGPFIIPKEVLLESLFGDDDHAYLYIPVEAGTRKHAGARLNPRNYHRTWHYIRFR